MALKGFENETATLSQYELNEVLPIVICYLSGRIGKRMAIKNRYICQKIRELDLEITEARIRKIINHIRVNNIIPCLIATSSGYYISYDKEELNDYIDSLIGRRDAINAVIEAMIEQSERNNGKA
jgi:hypothetical protein|nr:MAG TPA: hypothetical protein [Caudoviricetes sp.]